MSWLHNYHDRIVSAAEAVQSVKSGDRVYLTGNCSVPQALMKALVDRAPELTDVEITHILTLGKAPYVAPGLEQRFRHTAFFIGANVRSAVQGGGRTSCPSSSPRFRP